MGLLWKSSYPTMSVCGLCHVSRSGEQPLLTWGPWNRRGPARRKHFIRQTNSCAIITFLPLSRSLDPASIFQCRQCDSGADLKCLFLFSKTILRTYSCQCAGSCYTRGGRESGNRTIKINTMAAPSHIAPLEGYLAYLSDRLLRARYQIASSLFTSPHFTSQLSFLSLAPAK